MKSRARLRPSRCPDDVERAAWDADDPAQIGIDAEQDLVSVGHSLPDTANRVAGGLARIIQLKRQAVAQVEGAGRQ